MKKKDFRLRRFAVIALKSEYSLYIHLMTQAQSTLLVNDNNMYIFFLTTKANYFLMITVSLGITMIQFNVDVTVCLSLYYLKKKYTMYFFYLHKTLGLKYLNKVSY